MATVHISSPACIILLPLGRPLCLLIHIPLYPVPWPVRLTSTDHITELPMPSDFLWAQGSGPATEDQRWAGKWSQSLSPWLTSSWVSLACCICQPGVTPPVKGSSPSRFWEPLHHPLTLPGLRTVASQPSQDPGPCIILCALLTPSPHLQKRCL